MQKRNLGLVVVLVLGATAFWACGGTSTTTESEEPVTVEQIDGTELSRLTLSAKAAERLDVSTVEVRHEEVLRTWTVGAEVVDAPATGAANASAVWVRLALSKEERARVDGDTSARVQPLGSELKQGDSGPSALIAQPVEPAAGSSQSADEALYYEVGGPEHGLVAGQRVLVEVLLSGSQRLLVPYAAVIYDLNGDTWTYTNPEPLVFVRQSITIDYIEGDLAVLTEGPPAGTAVVVVGAAELFGVELGVGQ